MVGIKMEDEIEDRIIERLESRNLLLSFGVFYLVIVFVQALNGFEKCFPTLFGFQDIHKDPLDFPLRKKKKDDAIKA